MRNYPQRCYAAVAILLLTAACLVASGQVEATVRFVDQRWVDSALVPPDLESGTTAFASLAAAIDAAHPGDCIVLNPGRYERPTEQFPIVVDKAVAIRSAQGSTETVLSGPPLVAVFEIRASGVEIEGLTIEFRRYGVVVLADGVRVCGNRLRLAGPEFRQTSCGIWLAGAREAQIIGNEFAGCGIAMAGPPVSDSSKNVPVLTGLFEVGEDPEFFTSHSVVDSLVNGKPLCYIVSTENVNVPRDAGQIILAGCRDVSVDGVDVLDTSIGIEVAYSDRIRLSNVTASSCGVFGVYLCYASQCEIADTVCDNDTHGIDVRAARRIVIRDCEVSKCGQGIFLSWVCNSLISECAVQESGAGVFVACGQGNQIAFSTIDRNGLGISAQDEQSLLVTENLITSNTTNGVRLNSSGCTLCGNSFLKNWVGLVGFDSTGVSITGNEFCASTQCGLYVTNLDDLKMTLNEFVDSGNIDMEIAGALRDALIVQNSFSGPSSVIIDHTGEALDLSLNSWGASGPGEI